jgi:hypothetical protein
MGILELPRFRESTIFHSVSLPYLQSLEDVTEERQTE